MKEKLKKHLSKKRYEHSIGVAETAKKLASRYGADEDKAYIAGLLHDCAKFPDISDQIKLCGKYNMELDEYTVKIPAVIHAPLGARHAEEEYGIKDKEILDAIAYHTVGREHMTLLDKIIYAADMIEPSRDFKGVEKLRECKDLDTLVMQCLKESIIHNASKEKIIHPNTFYAWNYMIKNSHKG